MRLDIEASAKVQVHYFTKEYVVLKTPAKKEQLSPKYMATPTPPVASSVVGSHNPNKSTEKSNMTSWGSDSDSDTGSDTSLQPPKTWVVGMIYSAVSYKDLPFRSKSKKEVYSIPGSGYELCWVTSQELASTIGNHGDLHLPKTKTHPTLHLASYGVKEANEAFFTCYALAECAQTSAFAVKRGESPHHVLLFRHAEENEGKWSLVVEEISDYHNRNMPPATRHKSAFLLAASSRLQRQLEWKHVKDSSETLTLPMDIVRAVSYELRESMCEEWRASEEPPPESDKSDSTAPSNNSSPQSSTAKPSRNPRRKKKKEATKADSSESQPLGELVMQKLTEMQAMMSAKDAAIAALTAEMAEMKSAIAKRTISPEPARDSCKEAYYDAPPVSLHADKPPSCVSRASSADGDSSKETPPESIYHDGQLPHKWANPLLNLLQEQFVCQWTYSLMASKLSEYGKEDFPLLWRRKAEEVIQALLKANPTKYLKEGLPRPEDAKLHGLRALPQNLGPVEATPCTCAWCGRTSATIRFADVIGTQTDLESGYKLLRNVPLCGICTDTNHFQVSDPEALNECLHLSKGAYVRMPDGVATEEDVMCYDPRYASFSNKPFPGRKMTFGDLEVILEYPTTGVTPPPDPLSGERSSRVPGVLPIKKDAFEDSPALSSPIEGIEPVVIESTPVTVAPSGDSGVESPAAEEPTAAGTEEVSSSTSSKLKITWKDSADIVEHVKKSAKSFTLMPASKTSEQSVEDFATCVHDVEQFLTTDTRMVQWLGNQDALALTSLLAIMIEIVKVVAGNAHKGTIAESRDLSKKMLGGLQAEFLTVEAALDNFMNLFRKECLQLESVDSYVTNKLHSPNLRTFKQTEEHFRRALPLSKILSRQFGYEPLPEAEEPLKSKIVSALPTSIRKGIMSKLRDRAQDVEDVSFAKVTLQVLRELSHVVEQNVSSGRSLSRDRSPSRERSRSPSLYSRANAAVIPPQTEGGEGNSENFSEHNAQSANLTFTAHNRAQNTRAPPKRPEQRGRTPARRSPSPHPYGRANPIIPFDFTNADACANCGHPGHRAASCKETIDEDRIKQNIRAFVNNKASSVKGTSNAVLKKMMTSMEDAMYQEQWDEEDTDIDNTNTEDSPNGDETDDDEEVKRDSVAKSQRN